jgi:hypothetical protein
VLASSTMNRTAALRVTARGSNLPEWAGLVAICATPTAHLFAAQLEAVRAGVPEPRRSLEAVGARAEMSRL